MGEFLSHTSCWVTKVPLVKDKTYLIIGLFAPLLFLIYGNISILLLVLYYAFNLKNKSCLNKISLQQTLMAFIAIMPIIFALSFLSKLILNEYSEQEMVIELKKDIYKNFLTNFFVILIIAPIFEEIVFRGLFYKALKNFTPFIQASLISSIVFALIHKNILSFMILLTLSLFLTWIYERTNSILYPILAHSLFNLTTIIFILVENHA